MNTVHINDDFLHIAFSIPVPLRMVGLPERAALLRAQPSQKVPALQNENKLSHNNAT